MSGFKKFEVPFKKEVEKYKVTKDIDLKDIYKCLSELREELADLRDLVEEAFTEDLDSEEEDLDSEEEEEDQVSPEDIDLKETMLEKERDTKRVARNSIRESKGSYTQTMDYPKSGTSGNSIGTKTRVTEMASGSVSNMRSGNKM